MKTIFGVIAVLLSANAWAIKVELDVKLEGGDKPVVVGTTNLPDGMQLGVSLRRKESSYFGGTNVNVSGGTFKTEPFSQGDKSLNPGKYEVEISSPLADLQPAAVQAVIGDGGKNLEGPKAKKSQFGGKVISFKKQVTLGDGKSSKELDASAKKQELADRHDWWIKNCQSTTAMLRNVALKQGRAFDSEKHYKDCLKDEPKSK